MNKYRIYLNNANITDCVDIDADYAEVMANVTLFYTEGDLVASIPSGLVFIKI